MGQEHLDEVPENGTGPKPSGWFRRLWHRVFLPIEEPTEFLESPHELAKRVHTDNSDVAGEILSDARELFEESFLRAEAAERRATTLLGALAIAASFGLAGGGLLLDVEKLPPGCWRIGLALCYLSLVVALVGAAFRSLETLRVKVWSRPGDDSIFDRAGRSLTEGRIHLAADLLHSAGRNRPVARWKVAQVRAAAWWLTIAILALLAVASLIALYALFG